MIPIGGFDTGNKIGDARSILGNNHCHLACRTGKTIGHVTPVAFVSNIPEGDPCFREIVGNRHEGRTYDSKSMFNSLPLEHFDECFFRCHFHSCKP